MSAAEETSPVGAVEITSTRQQRIVETATASLRVPDFVDEFYLDDLRRLVDAAAHIPGDAVVSPHEYGINITYSRTVETDQDPLKDERDDQTARVPSDDAMDDLRSRLAAVDVRPAPQPESVPAASGDTATVDEVRAVVELIKDATGLSIRAVAELADVPPASLSSLMAPSYQSRTVRRSTYEKLHRVLDELAAEGAASTGAPQGKEVRSA